MKLLSLGALAVLVIVAILVFFVSCATLPFGQSEPYKIKLTDNNGVDHFAVTPAAWKIPQDIELLTANVAVFGGLTCIKIDFSTSDGRSCYFGIFVCTYTPRIVALETGDNDPLGSIIGSSRKWCVYDKYDGQNPRIVEKDELNEFVKQFLGVKPEPKTRT